MIETIKVLDAKNEFADNSLVDIYYPITTPASLVKTDNELNKAVDLAYPQ